MQVELNLESLSTSENNLNQAKDRFNQAEQQRLYYENLSKSEAAKLAQTSENVVTIKNTQQEFQQSLAKALSSSMEVSQSSAKFQNLPSLNKNASSTKLQKPTNLKSLNHSSSCPDMQAEQPIKGKTSLASPQKAKKLNVTTSVAGEKKLPPIK